MALLEAKKVASQYQKEADKCSSGMETCEEAREKAEATLEAQRKQTARAAFSFPLRSLYCLIIRTVSICSSSRNKVADPQAIKGIAETGKAYVHDFLYVNGRPVLIVDASKLLSAIKFCLVLWSLNKNEKLCVFLIEKALGARPEGSREILGIFNLCWQFENIVWELWEGILERKTDNGLAVTPFLNHILFCSQFEEMPSVSNYRAKVHALSPK
ncbi:CRAL-TRIO domain-containing protein-like [Pyrus ussuriensis x Pyrus communis]|uniref:CRAL-TRIO domain-containing protein-like n=1 Tax=Pyrus ussuriensis x Pyrus communis TaxID=2448454 RepID=A0A5N5FTS1_9ROSA|nr:CRAL-TRIO domain-containing protein-like [Pyrus ussuriensis x Pyrus communis]